MNLLRKGLNAFQIKIIALAFMTIDHIGVYQILSNNNAVNDMLRVLGRIAAPLFLFLLIEGLRHTRSKRNYIIRLYVAAVMIQIANRLFMKYIATGYFSPLSNNLPTFMYTALFIVLIEALIDAIRKNERLGGFLLIITMMIPFVFVPVYNYSLENSCEVLATFIEVLAPSLFTVEYSFIFVLLGIAWYFVNNKVHNCLIFAILCMFSFIIPSDWFFGSPIIALRPIFFNPVVLFTSTQWCMVLAIPFMLLYNGEKGRSCKYLFYLYYPLHQYFFFILQLSVIQKQ